MAKFKLQPGEQVLKEGSMPYLKSRLKYVAGGAHLTNQRFVHTNNLQSMAVGGLVGALIGARVDLEVPLEAIVRIGLDHHGRKNQEVLVLTTTDGKDHRLVAKLGEWLPAFEGALAQHRGARLVEQHPGAWMVAPAG